MKEFLAKCKYYFNYAFFFSFFVNILQLTFPIYMLQIYDKVISSSSVPTLVVMTVAAGFALLLLALLTWIRSRLLVRAGIEFDHLLSKDVLQANLHEAGAPTGHSLNKGTLSDVQTLRNFMAGGGIFAFFDIPWMPIYFILLFILHPALGWVATIGGIIIFILGLITEKVTRKRLNTATDINRRSSRLTMQAMRNANIVRSMGMVDNITILWKQINNNVMSLQTKASSNAAILNAIVTSFRMGLQILIYAVGAYLTIQSVSTAGIMIAASIIMGRAIAPIAQAMATYKNSISAYGSYKRLNELLQGEKAVSHMALPPPTGEISAENLFFAAQGRQIIKGISFRMAAGQSLAIIGPSASGKSTFCKLLLNIWAPTAGKVRLDRADINNWDPEKLGPYLGYLPQEVELFTGSIAQNIARMGVVDSQKVIKASQLSGVHDMILHLPHGYDTQIDEEGAGLSGGQKQRIGLARAMYGGPKLIVLDEPNANLDEEGERMLTQALINLKQAGTTVIIVTHKPQILNVVDNLIVMQDGQIAMSGPCRQVMAQLAEMRKQEQEKLEKARIAREEAKKKLKEQQNKPINETKQPDQPEEDQDIMEEAEKDIENIEDENKEEDNVIDAESTPKEDSQQDAGLKDGKQEAVNAG